MSILFKKKEKGVFVIRRYQAGGGTPSVFDKTAVKSNITDKSEKQINPYIKTKAFNPANTAAMAAVYGSNYNPNYADFDYSNTPSSGFTTNYNAAIAADKNARFTGNPSDVMFNLQSGRNYGPGAGSEGRIPYALQAGSPGPQGVTVGQYRKNPGLYQWASPGVDIQQYNRYLGM